MPKTMRAAFRPATLRPRLVAALWAAMASVVMLAGCRESEPPCYVGDFMICSCGGTGYGYAACLTDESGYGPCACTGVTPGMDASR